MTTQGEESRGNTTSTASDQGVGSMDHHRSNLKEIYAQASPSVKKALDRLVSDLNARVGYEGHEMIKTSFYRLRSRKKMEESYELAKYASVIEFYHSELHCGLEMAQMMLDALTEDGVVESARCGDDALWLVEQFAQGRDRMSADGDVKVNVMGKLKGSVLKWMTNAHVNTTFIKRVYALSGDFVYKVLGPEATGVALPDLIRSGDAMLLFSCVQKTIEEDNTSSIDVELLFARICLHILQYMPRARQEEGFGMVVDMERCFEAKYKFCDGGKHVRDFAVIFSEELSQGHSKVAKIVLEKYQKFLDARDPTLVSLAKDVWAKYTAGPQGGIPPVLASLFG